MSSDTAWAAGFFDGEGWIGIEIRADRPHKAKLSIVAIQKYPEPLYRLKDLFGGTVDQQNETRWRWRIAHAGAANALRRMRPQLVVKAAEADVALRAHDTDDYAEKIRAKEALQKMKRLPIMEREGVMPLV